MLQISTLAAAGLGNLVSDVAGLGLSQYIEAAAGKIGLSPHNLTTEQLSSSGCRRVVLAAR